METSQSGTFAEKNHIFHALEFNVRKDRSLAEIKVVI